jgi:hypothetical protein
MPPRTEDGRMSTTAPVQDIAHELLDVARDFEAASEHPGSHELAPDFLSSLEESLQVLSGAWYRMAGDAARIAERRSDPDAAGQSPDRLLSREQEVRLMSTLHDVAAAFARCARTCREARSTVTPIVTRDVDHVGAR